MMRSITGRANYIHSIERETSISIDKVETLTQTISTLIALLIMRLQRVRTSLIGPTPKARLIQR
jgi:hypothetical protein